MCVWLLVAGAGVHSVASSAAGGKSNGPCPVALALFVCHTIIHVIVFGSELNVTMPVKCEELWLFYSSPRGPQQCRLPHGRCDVSRRTRFLAQPWHRLSDPGIVAAFHRGQVCDAGRQTETLLHTGMVTAPGGQQGRCQTGYCHGCASRTLSAGAADVLVRRKVQAALTERILAVSYRFRRKLL
jgi:hypothetical protein